jgi:hypothetical protein
MAKRVFKNPDQLSLFNVNQYEQPITEASIDRDGWEPKSSPVARETVQRENFQWVEAYLVKQRFLYYRYCHLRSIDGIRQAVKIHIPGSSRSIREGRAALVKEAIAANMTPTQIEALIRGWQA